MRTISAVLKPVFTKRVRQWASLALGSAALAASSVGLRAADVTFERLLNPEPHNWLAHHRDFTA